MAPVTVTPAAAPRRAGAAVRARIVRAAPGRRAVVARDLRTAAGRRRGAAPFATGAVLAVVVLVVLAVGPARRAGGVPRVLTAGPAFLPAALLRTALPRTRAFARTIFVRATLLRAAFRVFRGAALARLGAALRVA